MIWLLKFLGPRRMLRVARTLLITALSITGAIAAVALLVKIRPRLDALVQSRRSTDRRLS